jgi:hypothetical protein
MVRVWREEKNFAPVLVYLSAFCIVAACPSLFDTREWKERHKLVLQQHTNRYSSFLEAAHLTCVGRRFLVMTWLHLKSGEDIWERQMMEA